MLSIDDMNISGTKTLTNALDYCFKQFGSSIAIIASGCKLTYAELDKLTSDIALELRSRCGGQSLKSQPVAILIPRSVEFYVAQIAVLRAGGFFLPIDPLQPTGRIEFLLSDSQASLLLVRETDSFTVPESAAVQFPIDVERWKEGGRVCSGRPAVDLDAASCGYEVDDKHLAYMIYTSGSTGQPKGVPIAHRAIWNLCHWWSEKFGISHGDRTLQMMSIGFDASLEEIFPTLATGGTLVPISSEALSSMEQFLDFIARLQVNHLHVPSAFWHTLSASLGMRESLKLPACVRTVVLGGEKVDPSQVELWFSKIGTEVRLINAYGPTETAVAASYGVLRPGEKPTIGKPIPGVSFCVVGKDGQLVKPGQPGELYIGGVGVAGKYWRREQLSTEKFVDSPLEDGQPYYRTGDLVRLGGPGNYEFIGRIDDQIKLRGYRVEPGEIANCLGAHPQVSQAHVAARKLSDAGALQLVGYVVAKPDEEPCESELRVFLSDQLPAYMVPVRIVSMESFPQTVGGKLDLERFPNPALDMPPKAQQNSELEVLTATEQKISKVWEEVLGTGQLGRDANFFQIGGDSLSAMRLVLVLESEFPGPVIPVAALIPNPTIASMAAYIDGRQHNSAQTVSENWPLLTRLGLSQEPISVVCIHAAGGGGMFYRQLYEGLEQAMPAAVLESAILYQSGPVPHQLQSIVEMARDYVDCLIDAGCQKKLTLAGYSLGGLLAFEMARLLNKQGYVVEKIINIDAPSPQSIKKRNVVSKFWYLSQSLGAVRLRNRQIAELEKWQKSKLPPPTELRPLALELKFGVMAEAYVPETSDISMHLIRAEKPNPTHYAPHDYGWTEKVSELTVVRIPGGHNTIFNQPNLQILIEAFQKALTE